jgi:hypothetical protein
MSYLLRFTGNENVTFASAINIPANNSDSFAYVFDINYNGNSNEVLFANPNSFNDTLRIASSTSIVFRAGSSNNTFTLTTALQPGRQILKIKKDVFDVAVYDANNNALSAVQSTGMTNNVFGFGEDSQNRNFSGDLYSAKIYSDFAETQLAHNFDANASGGTGTTLDNLATPANPGTLNKFTGTTDSWWVSYGGATYSITLVAGSYAYTGNDLALKADRKLSFDAGSYDYTGQQLTLTYTPTGGATYTITLDAGSYSYAGNDIVLAANRAILLEVGNYNYTGQPVILAANRKLSFDPGSYTLTGNDASLLASRKISLDAGVYNYVGNPMSLVFSGQTVTLIDDYSVSYADDDIKAAYADDDITAIYLN